MYCKIFKWLSFYRLICSIQSKFTYIISVKSNCGESCGAKYIDSYHIKLNSAFSMFTSIPQQLANLVKIIHRHYYIIAEGKYRRKKGSVFWEIKQLLKGRLYYKNLCKISTIQLEYNQSITPVLLIYTRLYFQVFLHLILTNKYTYCKRPQGCSTCWKVLETALSFDI